MSVLARPTLAFDPAIPQRDTLLDSTVVAERLSHLLARRGRLPIDRCKRLRVKYRIGARLRTVHVVHALGRRFLVSASTFPTPERTERAYGEALQEAVRCGPVAPVARDHELGAVFWVLPNDRKLRALPALVRPDRAVAGALEPRWAGSRLVAYAPEKAATVGCLDRAGRTLGFAKAYAGDEGYRTALVHASLEGALGEDPELRVPRALGYSPRHRTILVEAVPGRPVAALGAHAYDRLGRALARLHALPPPDAARFVRADPDRLERAADLIGSVRDDVAEAAHDLADALRTRAGGEGDSCLHGDVNFRNALLAGDRVTLIDLDQVARGPAAAELGSVLAALRYARIVELLPDEDVAGLEEAFLAGYAELGRLPADDELRSYTAAALLGERALRVVTRLREVGLARLPRLLDEAHEVLA